MTDEREDFKVAVLAMDQGCIASRPPTVGETFSPCDGEVQAHHVITQQQLRKAGLDQYLWTPQNGASLCYRHHRRHHNRVEPVTIAMLPQRCRDFAAKHFLTPLLERYYVKG